PHHRGLRPRGRRRRAAGSVHRTVDRGRRELSPAADPARPAPLDRAAAELPRQARHERRRSAGELLGRGLALTRRRGTAAVAAPLALVVATQAGAAGKERYGLRQVEFSDYPIVGLVVRGAQNSRPPAVFEDGRPVQGLNVQGLGRSKAVLLGIDRSKSMHGAPLNRAVAAARQYLNSKPNSDRVGVVSFGSPSLTPRSPDQPKHQPRSPPR